MTACATLTANLATEARSLLWVRQVVNQPQQLEMQGMNCCVHNDNGMTPPRSASVHLAAIDTSGNRQKDQRVNGENGACR
jgi:hypothetical protein